MNERKPAPSLLQKNASHSREFLLVASVLKAERIIIHDFSFCQAPFGVRFLLVASVPRDERGLYSGMPDNLVYAPARGWRHIQAIRHHQRPHVCGSGKRTEEIKELRLNKSLADTNGALVLDGACECAH